MYLILGLLTGVATITYQILTHKVSAYMIFLGGLALIIVFLISLYALRIWNKMQEINKGMENV